MPSPLKERKTREGASDGQKCHVLSVGWLGVTLS